MAKGAERHIADKVDRITVYHHLQVLLAQTDHVEFHLKLQQFLSYIKTEHSEFYSYFSTYYCNRIEEWAVCHRKWKCINTNMIVEAFHRVLKGVYLEGKQNRRVDHLLHKLFTIAKDAAFNRFIKLNIGKNTHRITEINRRHITAQKIMDKEYHLENCSENLWTIRSQQEFDIVYTLEQVVLCNDCKLRFSHCDACVHMYTCTCMDLQLYANICTFLKWY